MNATLPSTRPVIAVPLLPFSFLSAPWRGFSVVARLPGDGGRTETHNYSRPQRKRSFLSSPYWNPPRRLLGNLRNPRSRSFRTGRDIFSSVTRRQAWRVPHVVSPTRISVGA